MNNESKIVETSQPVTATERDEMLTKKELAVRLKITVRSIENWQRRGVLPYIKIGKVVLFVWADVVEAVKRFRVCRRTIMK